MPVSVSCHFVLLVVSLDTNTSIFQKLICNASCSQLRLNVFSIAYQEYSNIYEHIQQNSALQNLF